MPPSISERIAVSIDPSDATPLYHQLAAVVRWEVVHGRLPLGTMLPPVREVASLAGVNYHTVRRAWGDLEAEGVISQRRGRGARVIRAPRRADWSPAGADAGTGLNDTPPRVWIVAPALGSAAVLAEAIGSRWNVEAAPWPLTATAPPPGLILSTVAASAAAISQWPAREGDLRFLATTLPQATIGVIRRNAALLGVAQVVIRGGQGDDAARDLHRQLPRLGLRVELAPDRDVGTEPEPPDDAMVLYFPEAWSRLDWSGRMHPRAVLVEAEWAAGPLAGAAREQVWRER